MGGYNIAMLYFMGFSQLAAANKTQGGMHRSPPDHRRLHLGLTGG